MTASKSSSLMRAASLSRVMPALLTRMSTPPNADLAVSTSSLAASAEVTSPWTARAWAPAASSSDRVSSAAALLPA